MSGRQALPVATLLIIGANIAAGFLLIWQRDLIGYYGFDLTNPSFLTAFTSLFLHQNVLHLLGNMVFLAAVGPAVESAAGTLRFLIVYLVGGFVGVATHFAFAAKTGAPPPLLGASGCISAVIGYSTLRYHHVRVNLAPGFRVPAFAMVGVWVALQAAGAFISLNSVQGGTAYWAHLGGFAAGLILSLIFRAPVDAQREMSLQTIGEMDRRSPAAKLAAADQMLKRHPNDLKALREKADALATLNEHDKEADCLIQALEQLPDLEQQELLSRLDKIKMLDRIPSLRRTRLADKFKSTEPDLSRLLLLSVVQDRTDSQRPDALFALASLDFEPYPENAAIWLKDLITNYPLHAAADLARAKGWTP